jgi:hypothetical protein
VLLIVSGTRETTGRYGLKLLAVAADGTTSDAIVATEIEPRPGLPSPAFSLLGTFPNPAAASTTIRIDLPAPAEVGVEVFDMLGRVVRSQPPILVSEGQAQSLHLDTSGLSQGTYLYRVTADGPTWHEATGRLVIVR